MGRDEITGFLSHLAVDERLSASTQNQAFNALLFLYKVALEKDVGQLREVVRADRPRRLPVVLTHEEVGLLFDQLDGTVLLVCRLLYGSGLRLRSSRANAPPAPDGSRARSWPGAATRRPCSKTPSR
jgi:site-specific recombinase XerD